MTGDGVGTQHDPFPERHNKRSLERTSRWGMDTCGCEKFISINYGVATWEKGVR